MHYIYVVFYKGTITITREPPTYGVVCRWKEKDLTTKKLRKLQSKYPNEPIIVAESVIGLIQKNDEEAAAKPITKGEKKPFDPNSNRLKFELKEIGKRTYSGREIKPRQDHIARHNAPILTDRDSAARSSDISTNPYTEFIQKHKTEILQDREVREAIDKVILDLFCKEHSYLPNPKAYIKALKEIFPEIFN